MVCARLPCLSAEERSSATAEPLHRLNQAMPCIGGTEPPHGCPADLTRAVINLRPQPQLTFRTVNSSRSAYACFEFRTGFFSKYELTVEGDEGTDEGYSINCKTLSKVRPLLVAEPPPLCSVARAHPQSLECFGLSADPFPRTVGFGRSLQPVQSCLGIFRSLTQIDKTVVTVSRKRDGCKALPRAFSRTFLFTPVLGRRLPWAFAVQDAGEHRRLPTGVQVAL